MLYRQFSTSTRLEGALSALAVLAILVLALPFLWGLTRPPSSNFWPLAASWLCAAALLLVSALQALLCSPWGAQTWARILGAALLIAALASSAIGLAQYFGLGDALSPWVYPAPSGQAMGNLRQRNQQATLLSLGAWALVW